MLTILRTLVEWLRRWLQQRLNTQFPGVVMAYDPVKQRADVQPLIKRRRRGEDDEPIDERLPVIPSVPILFPGNSKFEDIWDVEVGDRVWVECSQDSLDDYLQDGNEAPARDLPRYAIHDAVITGFLRDFGHARVPCPKGMRRWGAVDGPQIEVDLNTMKLTARSINEVAVIGDTRVDIRSPSGDVYVQGRWVDPLGGDI